MAMTMRQVQNLLQYLGYYESKPDDIYGPMTRDATFDFQVRYGTIGADDIYGPMTRDATFDFQVRYGTIGADGIPGPETEAALIDAVATGKYFKYAPEATPEQPQEEPDSDDFWAGIKYFKREEFRCKCGGKYCDGFPVEPDRNLVRALDKFRERLGVAVNISGIRCPQHNANQKDASPTSQHLYGRAADCHSSKSPEEMRRVAEEVLQGTGGLGIYNWGIHFDVRDGKSRWDSR